MENEIQGNTICDQFNDWINKEYKYETDGEMLSPLEKEQEENQVLIREANRLKESIEEIRSQIRTLNQSFSTMDKSLYEGKYLFEKTKKTYDLIRSKNSIISVLNNRIEQINFILIDINQAYEIGQN